VFGLICGKGKVLADRKITELANITGANLADADEFVVVDASADETKAITFAELKSGLDTATGFVRITGDTMTGDLNFGDNDKAIFGAGSDLQIYHDGSNSYIKDLGTGNLIIDGTNLTIRDSNTAKVAISIQNNSDEPLVQLRYDNATKLATTSTGVDITGTLTSDGLTVENTSGATLNVNTGLVGADSKILLHEGSTASPANGASIRYAGATNEFSIGVGSSVDTKRISIARDTGDISFYEDTGTTPKFFWDASAERLGIGTSAPARTLSVERTGGTSIVGTFKRTDAASAYITFEGSTTTTDAHVGLGADSDDLFLRSGNAERMRIDSSGNIGIGTSSPDSGYKLDVAGNVVFGDGGGFDMNVDGTRWQFSLAGSEKMRIDSSGNIGIGTTSPNYALDVEDSGGGFIKASFVSTGSTHSSIVFDNTGSSANSVRVGSQNNDFYVRTSGTERMRIDSSGNLLVGHTTVDSFTNVGHQLDADGYAIHTRTSAPALYVGRKTTDGSIMEFNKDGTTVGSIGTNSGNIYLTDGARSLIVDGSVVKAGYSTGGDADNAQDLGSSSVRWKDLYLSGGVYLGGTGAANKLDDYEEGTWTPAVGGATTDPTVTYTSQTGYYTKIGRMVHIQMFLNCSAVSGGSGAVKVTGIPFQTSTASNSYGAAQMEIIGVDMPSDRNNIVVRLNPNYGHFRFEFLDNRASTTNGSSGGLQVSSLGNSFRVLGSFTYMTDA